MLKDITKIYISEMIIRRNRNLGLNEPPLIIKRVKGKVRYAHKVILSGPSTIVYKRNPTANALGRSWIETEHPIAILLDGDSLSSPTAEITTTIPVSGEEIQ